MGFEEITRCPVEMQDCLLALVPEPYGPQGPVFTRLGFNAVATAHTRDRASTG